MLSSAVLFMAAAGAVPATAQDAPPSGAMDPAANRITIGAGLAIASDTSIVPLIGHHRRSPVVAKVGDPDQWSGAVGVRLTF